MPRQNLDFFCKNCWFLSLVFKSKGKCSNFPFVAFLKKVHIGRVMRPFRLSFVKSCPNAVVRNQGKGVYFKTVSTKVIKPSQMDTF